VSSSLTVSATNWRNHGKCNWPVVYDRNTYIHLQDESVGIGEVGHRQVQRPGKASVY
jgi:hypothetical protein